MLTHLAVAIADGADCLADMASLREQEELFGPVASMATAWRAVEATTAFELRAIPEAMAAARAVVWAARPPGDSIDAGLRRHPAQLALGEGGRRPHLQAGLRVLPLGRVVRHHQEPLAAMLRPGNAGANDTDDHIELFDRALSGLPEEYRPATSKATIPPWSIHPILVRADSAGATHGFVDAISGCQLRLLDRIPHRPGEFVMPCSWSKRRTGCRPERPTGRSETAPG